MREFLFLFLHPLLATNLKEAGEIIQTSAIGPLRVVKQLGRGRNAVVYQTESAESIDDSRFFAVKVIPREDQDILAREVEVLTALNSTEGFPRIYGSQEGLIVMEMLEGRSLDKPSQEALPLTMNEIAVQLISLLQAVHETGFVHVDMHTRNIMINDDHVALLDFGLAVRIREMKNPVYVNIFLSSVHEQRRSPLFPIDDIERLMYVLINFQVQLPWAKLMKMRDMLDKERRSQDVNTVITALEARILAMKLEFSENESFFEKAQEVLSPAYRKVLTYITASRAERETLQIDYSYLRSLFGPLLPLDPLESQPVEPPSQANTLIPINL